MDPSALLLTLLDFDKDPLLVDNFPLLSLLVKDNFFGLELLLFLFEGAFFLIRSCEVVGLVRDRLKSLGFLFLMLEALL